MPSPYLNMKLSKLLGRKNERDLEIGQRHVAGNSWYGSGNTSSRHHVNNDRPRVTIVKTPQDAWRLTAQESLMRGRGPPHEHHVSNDRPPVTIVDTPQDAWRLAAQESSMRGRGPPHIDESEIGVKFPTATVGPGTVRTVWRDPDLVTRRQRASTQEGSELEYLPPSTPCRGQGLRAQPFQRQHPSLRHLQLTTPQTGSRAYEDIPMQQLRTEKRLITPGMNPFVQFDDRPALRRDDTIANIVDEYGEGYKIPLPTHGEPPSQRGRIVRHEVLEDPFDSAGEQYITENRVQSSNFMFEGRTDQGEYYEAHYDPSLLYDDKLPPPLQTMKSRAGTSPSIRRPRKSSLKANVGTCNQGNPVCSTKREKKESFDDFTWSPVSSMYGPPDSQVDAVDRYLSFWNAGPNVEPDSSSATHNNEVTHIESDGLRAGGVQSTYTSRIAGGYICDGSLSVVMSQVEFDASVEQILSRVEAEEGRIETEGNSIRDFEPESSHWSPDRNNPTKHDIRPLYGRAPTPPGLWGRNALTEEPSVRPRRPTLERLASNAGVKADSRLGRAMTSSSDQHDWVTDTGIESCEDDTEEASAGLAARGSLAETSRSGSLSLDKSSQQRLYTVYDQTHSGRNTAWLLHKDAETGSLALFRQPIGHRPVSAEIPITKIPTTEIPTSTLSSWLTIQSRSPNPFPTSHLHLDQTLTSPGDASSEGMLDSSAMLSTPKKRVRFQDPLPAKSERRYDASHRSRASLDTVHEESSDTYSHALRNDRIRKRRYPIETGNVASVPEGAEANQGGSSLADVSRPNVDLSSSPMVPRPASAYLRQSSRESEVHLVSPPRPEPHRRNMTMEPRHLDVNRIPSQHNPARTLMQVFLAALWVVWKCLCWVGVVLGLFVVLITTAFKKHFIP